MWCRYYGFLYRESLEAQFSRTKDHFYWGMWGKTPEAKATEGGAQYGRFSVATNEKWTDANGTKQERTTWHNVMVWGRQAEVALQYLHKGNLVHIEGRLRNNEWEKDGQKHRSTAIVVDRLTLMLQGERRQGSLSTDFEREIEESVRPQVEPLKPEYMKPMEPITSLPEDGGDINVADIPF